MATETQTIRRPFQNSFSSTVEALQFMLQTERHVDVSVGQDRLAHKLVLALWSPVLADLLMRDNSKVCTVPLSDSQEVTDIVIRYMYDLETKDDLHRSLPVETVLKVFECAEKFGLGGLSSRCVRSVHSVTVTASNVVDILNAALRMRMDGLAAKCRDVLASVGVSARTLSPGVSKETVLQLLQLTRLAVDGESQLLRLAASWLAQRGNLQHRRELLSLLDLGSIEWRDYQSIVRDHPQLFTDSELATVLLGVARSETRELSRLFGCRTETVVRRSCRSSCSLTELFVAPRLAEASFRPDVTADDLKVEFGFTTSGHETVRLVAFDLSFGPDDVPEDRFAVTASVRPRWHADPFKGPSATYIDLARRGRARNFEVLLLEPAELQSGHKLFVSFDFDFGTLSSDRMDVGRMKAVSKSEKPFLNGRGSNPRVALGSHWVPVYWSKSFGHRPLVASLKFRVCGDHGQWLERRVVARRHSPGHHSSVAKRAKRLAFDDDEDATVVIKMEVEH